MLTFDEENHLYCFEGKPVQSVTQILKSAGLIDDQWFTEAARRRGQYVHEAAQYLDEEDLNWENVDPILQPYLRAYEKFKAETGFIPILIEKRLYNPTYQYAGTLDRTGVFKTRQEVLIDIKSGSVAPWAALQLAGYNECLPKKLPRFALQLNNDGTYKLYSFKDPMDHQIFLSVLAVVRWRQHHGGLKHGNNPGA